MSSTRPAYQSPFGRPRARVAAPAAIPAVPAVSQAPAERAQPAPPVARLRPFGGFAPGVRAARVPRAVAVPTPAPAPAPASTELFDGLGFTRFEGAPRPLKVSADVWDGIFPPDRQRVVTLAGRRFIAGHDPDEAVRAAAVDVEAEHWAAGTLAMRAASMAAAMGEPSARIPARHLAEACLAATPTARTAWRDILASPTPERTAWWLRTWHVPEGTCMVCGKAASPLDKRYKSARDGVGDAVHQGACQERLASVGRAFGSLVVAEARRIEADPPPESPEAPSGADLPDDGEDAEAISPPGSGA